jgi:hypothetical protein
VASDNIPEQQAKLAIALNALNTRILNYTEQLASVEQDPDDVHAELDVFIQELTHLRDSI